MSGPDDREESLSATGLATPLEAPASATCVAMELGDGRRVLELADFPEVLIGRAADVTISIDHEKISRRHLRLQLREGVVFAADLGSRNGTLLNGARLVGERRLRGGDVLQLGPLTLVAGGLRRPTGLMGESDLVDRLDEEVERARAFRRPLAIIGLVLDGAASLLDAATTRLASRIARTEALGEEAPGRLLVLLPERTADDARLRAAELTEVVRELAGVTVGSRVAAFPDDGTSADALLASAWNAAAPARSSAGTLVIADTATVRVLETARRAARSNATVLVTGETGAGKEWVASEIHAASTRAAGPFVALNCAAIPENLLESELFGHEKGAFTGADKKRIGRVESAAGGTLFLDEVGELPLAMQAKMLRSLEQRRVTRVGGNEEIEVDVRFVAATNRDLEAEVRAGRFREDLYFRLSAITIHLPPLRERPEDLRALTAHFITTLASAQGLRPPTCSAGFSAALNSYPWPGNVRELRNVIERALVLGDGKELTTRELPDRLQLSAPPPPDAGPMRRKVEDVERQSVEDALAETNGNRTHAARKLGISRRTLIYKLHKYGLA